MLIAVFEALREALVADKPVCVATVIGTERPFDDAPSGGGDPAKGAALGSAMLVSPDSSVVGSLGNPDLDRVVCREALGHLESGVSAIRHFGERGQARQEHLSIFIEAFVPPPRMIIFGAVDFSASLARVAKALGFKVTVCDARETFATRRRFPMADDVIVSWPQKHLDAVGDSLGPRDAICVLTHDPKFDVPALVGAVHTAAGYIGAMGSRRTAATRDARLREAGLDDKDLARIMAPIGLDIGASTPEETAISICAEIIAVRSGHVNASSLSTGVGPIHGRALE